MLITVQVATAPCTDPIQVQVRPFEAKPSAEVAHDVLKAVVLFACETLLFFAVNIGGFVIAYNFV